MKENDQIKKREHFVPSFYLHNFTDNNDLLWIYDRKEDKYFQNIPENICYKKNIYETEWEDASEKLGRFVFHNQLENLFSQKEREWARIIRKILKMYELFVSKQQVVLVCSSTEKKELIQLFICSYFRNPVGISDVLEYYTAIDDKSNAELAKSINEIRKMFDRENLGSPKSFLQHSIKMMAFDSEMQGSPANVYTKLLREMHMCFLCSKKGQFITTSLPTLYIEGIENAYHQFILPLSPYVALVFSDDPDFRVRRNRFNYVDENTVDTINYSYLAYEKEWNRFLISQSRDYLERLVNHA